MKKLNMILRAPVVCTVLAAVMIGVFAVKASIPNSISGGHDFVAYARSALTGEETVVSVPVFVGAAPTATPRPTS